MNCAVPEVPGAVRFTVSPSKIRVKGVVPFWSPFSSAVSTVIATPAAGFSDSTVSVDVAITRTSTTVDCCVCRMNDVPDGALPVAVTLNV